MTRADKIRWLSRYNSINSEYQTVFESYKQYRLALTSIKAQIITDMPVAHCVRDKILEQLIVLEGLQQKALAIEEQLQMLELQIMSKINLIEINKSKTILTYRYIKGYTWGEIRKEMKLTRMGIYKLHVKGLDALTIGGIA